MKKLYLRIRFKTFLIFVLLFAVHASAQKNIKAYTGKNIVPIANIDPDSINFSDLKFIGNSIGDANVVMLGEEDHGDAPTFLAKTRLIKYLHEKKGFNVLAFESDFFGLNYGWDRVGKSHLVIDNFIRKNIFHIWTTCDACNTLLYHYIPATYNTANPLVVSGFDSQQYLDYSLKLLTQKLDSVLKCNSLPIVKQANYPNIIKLIDSSQKWVFTPPKDSTKVVKCYNALREIKVQLGVTVSSDSFWLPVVDGLIEEIGSLKDRMAGAKITDYSRDTQMAKNLEWLIANKFKGQKIIVWAADYHIGRLVGNFKMPYYNNGDNMGSHLARDEKDNQKLYILGFTSYQGTAGRVGTPPYNVHIPFKNSFETWVNKDYAYAFLDFKAYNTANPQADEYFYMAGLGHMDLEAQWNHVFDGVIFIKDMYPCKSQIP